MMIRSRYNITALMALVVGVGLGLAALRNSDLYWATGAYSLDYLTLAAATACALAGQGRARRILTGFAAFGMTYLLFDLLPTRESNIFGFGPSPRPTLLLDKGFALLQPYLKPMPATDVQGFIHYDQVAQSIGIILSGLFGATLSWLVAGNREADDHAPGEGG